MFAADASRTDVYCGNYPDLSSGSGTIVTYAAGTGTVFACDPSTVGYNVELTFTVAYSAVAGSTTEAELRITRTAAAVSDVNPATATCKGALSIGQTLNYEMTWASFLQADENDGLNQMTSICRVSRDVDTLKFSCRDGFGGARRRRRVAWSDCSESAPASSNTAPSESECISAHTATLQSASCTKQAQPSNSSGDSINVGAAAGIVIAVLVVIAGSVAACCFFCTSCPVHRHMNKPKDGPVDVCLEDNPSAGVGVSPPTYDQEMVTMPASHSMSRLACHPMFYFSS